MPVTVRPARITDARFLAEGNCAMALETENLQLDPALVLQGVTLALEDPHKALYFVAEVEGQPAGMLMITREWSDWRSADIWWIQSVYVAEQFRRGGVFSTLYRYVQSMARQSGACGLRLYVEKENSTAQSTYRHLGMELTHYSVMEEMF